MNRIKALWSSTPTEHDTDYASEIKGAIITGLAFLGFGLTVILEGRMELAGWTLVLMSVPQTLRLFWLVWKMKRADFTSS